MIGESPVGSAPRGAVALMFDRQFGSLFWGKLLAAVASWIFNIVAAIAMFDATGSAFMVGLVGAVQFVPFLILAPLSGRLADQGRLTRQMIAGRVVVAIASFALAAYLGLRGGPSGDVFAIVFAALVAGLGFVYGGPAMQSVVPRLVTEAELPVALTLNSVPMTMARVAGPAIGAVLAASVGAVPALLVAGAASLLFVLGAAFARVPDFQPGRADTSVGSAARHVWRDRPLRLLLVGIGAVAFGSEPALALAPAYVAEAGAGVHLVGVITSSFGVGAGVGLLSFPALSRRMSVPTATLIGFWAVIAGLGLWAVSWTPAVVVAGVACCGFGFSFVVTGVTTQVQERTPAQLRGRVMAFWMVAFVGVRPPVLLIEGFLADLTSTAVVAGGAALVLAAVVVLIRPRRIARIG